MEYQLIVKNAKYYAADRFWDGDILIADGKITAIMESGGSQWLAAENTIDARGLIVAPGFIDSHVHFREPGSPDRENFFSGSCAAAAGGITTFCEMPNSCPPPNCVANLQRRIDLAEEKSVVDFAMFGAAGYGNTQQFASLLEQGVIAFKTFLQPSPAGREEEFAGLTANGDGELYAMMRAGAVSGGRYFFHCEDADLIAMLERELHEAGEEGYDFHYRSRCDLAEVAVVEKIIRFAEATGCKAGIVHITVPESCRLIKEAKARGVDIAAETCFQYLIYDESAIDRFGPCAKTNPPFRSRQDVEGLWPYLLDGTINMIGSDHAPLTADEKKRGEKQIWKAFSGIAGVEVMLPLMLDQVAKGRISLAQLIRSMSENTARLYGLYPRKGAIAVGSDADLTIIDPEREYTLSSADMYTMAHANNRMFDGLRLKGRPVFTVSRGRVVMSEGKVDTAARGHGRFVAAGV